MVSAPLFQVRTSPDGALVMMASSQLSTTSARKRRDSSAAFCSVTSLPKTEMPAALPLIMIGLREYSRIRQAEQHQLSAEWPLSESAFIVRWPKRSPVWRKQFVEAHPRCNLKAKFTLQVVL